MYWFGDDLYDMYLPLKQEKSETVAEIEFLMDIIGGIKYKDHIIGKTLNNGKRDLIKSYIKERVTSGKPIQQIVGKAFFCGEIFNVNEYTLIPRPETELIIEVLKDYFSYNRHFKMLEIGIGTGCISVMAAKIFKNSQIVGVDICKQCIDISRKNAVLLGVSSRVNFLLSDIFENVSGSFDVIVSNPPYISYSDTKDVQENVLKFEPHTALFAKNDGYYFYEKIIAESVDFVSKNSVLIFETGINQEKKISKILKENHYNNIQNFKDFNNINRVISAEYNP